MTVSEDLFCAVNATAGPARDACLRSLELGRSHDWAPPPPPPPTIVSVIPPGLAGIVGLAVVVLVAAALLITRRALRSTRVARHPVLGPQAASAWPRPGCEPLTATGRYSLTTEGAGGRTAPQGGPSC